MTVQRKNEIPIVQLEEIATIASKVMALRIAKGLSIERFCARYEIQRITYSNIEKGKSGFQITTLMTILTAHQMDLKSFFQSL